MDAPPKAHGAHSPRCCAAVGVAAGCPSPQRCTGCALLLRSSTSHPTHCPTRRWFAVLLPNSATDHGLERCSLRSPGSRGAEDAARGCVGQRGSVVWGSTPRPCRARGRSAGHCVCCPGCLRRALPLLPPRRAASSAAQPRAAPPEPIEAITNECLLLSPSCLSPLGVDSFLPPPSPTLISFPPRPISRGGVGTPQSGVTGSSASPSSPCARWWEPAWCPS